MNPLSPPSRCALRLRWQLVSVLLCLLALGNVAMAAPAVGAALKKFEEGVSAFTANNYGEALTLFEASMELEPSPNTRFKIAKCYLALGRIGSAYSNFRRAAKEAQDRVNATGEQRFASTKQVADVEAAQLETQVPRIYLTLPADLAADLVGEVTISLDGKMLPATILGSAIEIDAGPHRVNVTGPHVTPFEQGFEMAPAENKRIELAVVRRKAGNIILSFKKRPVGLAVAIDAQPIASNLVDSPITLGIGIHRVVASAPGYLDATSEQTLHDQENLPVAIDLLPAPRPVGGPPKALTFVLAGTSLALLGVGITYGVMAQNTANEQIALDPLFRDSNIRDAVRVNASIANTFFGLSGAFGIATVVVAATTHWRTPPALPAKKVANFLNPFPVLPSTFQTTATAGEH